MAVSIKKNFLYSSILTVSNYIFPFITYPYVSRVLGVTNIGLCNFVDSIINYFVLLSMMGISIMGIREIAIVRQDKRRLSRTFSSLLLLNSITTAIALIAVVSATYLIPKLYENKELMFIGVFKLLSNFLLIDWLYKGLEEFKYVTKITLISKILYVISIFVFVHVPQDYPVYYLLSTLMISVNALFNCLYSRRVVHFQFRDSVIGCYVKPFFILGIYLLLTSMYTSFNVAYLGFVCNPTEVGYYTTATKLYTIIIAFYTAFSGVMMPRMSALLAENRMDEFKSLINKSIGILFSITIPAVMVSCIFSPEIIELIAGAGYEGAITPTRIVMPLLCIIGYEQILVIQVLMPLKEDRGIFINSIVGACAGILLNLLLVKNLASTGSALVWLISELVVLNVAQYFVFKNIGFRFPFRFFIKNVSVYLPALCFCLLAYYYLPGNSLVRLGCIGFFMMGYMIYVQKKHLKNELFLAMFNGFMNRIKIR